MLVTSCCKNYVCLSCSIEIADHFLEIRCPHCNHLGIHLNDVVQSDDIKFYSDSPLRKRLFQEAVQSTEELKSNELPGKEARKMASGRNDNVSLQSELSRIEYE